MPTTFQLKLTSLDAHWNPAITLSLISLRYCTPFEQSISRLGPVPSGPKHQTFRASVTSYSYFSARSRARAFGSCLGAMSPYVCVCVGGYKNQLMKFFIIIECLSLPSLTCKTFSQHANHCAYLINVLGKSIRERLALHEEPVVFVG